MPRVEVYIDMDEFTNDEILETLAVRYDSFNKEHKKRVLTIIGKASVITEKTLSDTLKKEHYTAVVDKYSIAELYQILDR